MIAAEFIAIAAYVSVLFKESLCRDDPWLKVRCNQVYNPEFCNYTDLSATVDEMDRCAPALLELSARNYFLAGNGRRTTYKDNKDAFDRIRLRPKMLRDVSNLNMETFVLGRKVDFPIGLSPVAWHRLVVPDGEKETVRGLSGQRTVMMLSALSTTLLEEVAAEARSTGVRLWMQVYIFANRSVTLELVRRAERSGFEAIALTVDSPTAPRLSCNSRFGINAPPGVKPENIDLSKLALDPSATFKDIRWLKSYTNLPIIAKGILSGDDAKMAVLSGASAILVSNHGGRQLDGDPATIDALPGVVHAVRSLFPPPEVYVDGGVRSGHDVFKALARGARMVFVGRPQIWGLAYGGAAGVRAMMKNLVDDFNETMQMAGVSKLSQINTDFLLPSKSFKSAPLIPRWDYRQTANEEDPLLYRSWN